jgi:hypothetical protein
MREIFKPAPGEPADPGRVFYTIAPEDVGKRVIVTEIGPINVRDIMGHVLPDDVGKRLYRVPARVPGPDRSDLWFWQAENDAQRDARLAPAHTSSFTVSTSTGRTFRYQAMSAEQAREMFDADRQEMNEISRAQCGQFVAAQVSLTKFERAMIPPMQSAP